MPYLRYRSFSAVILSGALHGCAFWAAGLVSYEPLLSADRHPPVELLTIVEIEEPEPIPIASKPGLAPGSEDSHPIEDPEPAPPVAKPKPKTIPTEPLPRQGEPSDAAVEEQIPPALVPRPLPTSVKVMPSVPNAGRIRLPQSPISRGRALAGTSKSAPGRQSAGNRQGGQADEHNPVLLTTLDPILRRHYPNEAREAGIEGYAKLDLVVTRWGRPESIRIVESHGHAGFGEACVRTVKRSRWRPAKDPAGRRIAMRVRYRCRFTVDH